MKIVVVVGTRPNLVKFAALAKPLAVEFRIVSIDTGQHYDRGLSSQLWEEFRLPKPQYQLHVGSKTHGRQTARMLETIERILMQEKPSGVVVFGDTNSALAGALAASKIPLPIAHVEAGVRVSGGYLPEEVNRVLIDHVSSVLFCPNRNAVASLAREGIKGNVHLVGDLLYQFLRATQHVSINSLDGVEELPGKFVLLTIHRAENTDDPARLRNILDAVGSLRQPVIFPIHPRTRAIVRKENISVPHILRIVNPVPYQVMIQLQRQAEVILTDSGGVQREAYYLGRPCVVVRSGTEWPETMLSGASCIVHADKEEIMQGYHAVCAARPKQPHMISNVADRIVDALGAYFGRHRG